MPADRREARGPAANELPLHRYARAIERSWARLRDRPTVLSPREWSMISRWYAQGVPLDLIRETMADLAGRSAARRGPPQSLTYVAAAIEESWNAVLDGRRGGGPAGDAPPRGAPATAWRERRDLEPPGSGLRELLERLLGRLVAGEDATSLDDDLDAGLPRAAPEPVVLAVDAAVAAELAPFRGRIPAERLAATLDRARVERLRRRLGLPRLADDRAARPSGDGVPETRPEG